MATTAPAQSTSVSTADATKADSPVPLDTIPISPANDDEKTGLDESAAPNGNESTAKKQYGDDEQITVFHDADNFNVKHPLMHKWTLWFTKPPSGKVRGDRRGSCSC